MNITFRTKNIYEYSTGITLKHEYNMLRKSYIVLTNVYFK